MAEGVLAAEIRRMEGAAITGVAMAVVTHQTVEEAITEAAATVAITDRTTITMTTPKTNQAQATAFNLAKETC